MPTTDPVTQAITGDLAAPPTQPPPLPPARGRSAPRVRVPWWSRALLFASNYLPLLLMVALALGTWWLVRQTPVDEGPRAPRALLHEADYTMQRFVVQRFGADGALRGEIVGDTMRHFPDTDTIEIENPRLRAIAPDGRVMNAQARRAVANSDGSEVQLLGSAQVRREPFDGEAAIEFTGEFLHAFIDAERVRSHLPVTVRRGSTEVQAETLDYDHLAQLLKLGGRVRATIPAHTERRPPDAAPRARRPAS